MPILYVSGDLFENRYGAQAFAHGCNCQGSRSAGIAKGFRERYPEMYDEYRRRCRTRPRAFYPGDVFLWQSEREPWVFNLGTQEGYWRSRASYQAVTTALERMRRQADEEEIRTIAIPKIGTRYGGLSWTKVRALVEQVFGQWPGTLYVYEAYLPAAPGDR